MLLVGVVDDRNGDGVKLKMITSDPLMHHTLCQTGYEVS